MLGYLHLLPGYSKLVYFGVFKNPSLWYLLGAMPFPHGRKWAFAFSSSLKGNLGEPYFGVHTQVGMCPSVLHHRLHGLSP